MLSLSKGINLNYYHNAQAIAEAQKPWEQFVDIEKTCGRTTCRIVRVFTELKLIDLDWVGVQSLIQIQRIGIRLGKKYLMANYYISSLLTSAAKFATGIRQHWGIENRLHWVKDVVFGEDTAPSLITMLPPTGLLSAMLLLILLARVATIR